MRSRISLRAIRLPMPRFALASALCRATATTAAPLYYATKAQSPLLPVVIATLGVWRHSPQRVLQIPSRADIKPRPPHYRKSLRSRWTN